MRQNRLLLLAGAVIAAAAIAGVLIAVASSKHSNNTTSSPGSTTTGLTANPFAGIQQRGDTLGDPAAPATLLVFEDPQCPFCQEWALGTLPQVLTDYVRTGRVKLVYRGIEVIGPNSQVGLRATYAAGLQNKLWNFAEALYRRQGSENSGWITDAVIKEAAAAAGANGPAIVAAAGTSAVAAPLSTAAQEASAAGINGTPTFVLEHPPGLPQALSLSALDPSTFEAALEQALSS